MEKPTGPCRRIAANTPSPPITARRQTASNIRNPLASSPLDARNLSNEELEGIRIDVRIKAIESPTCQCGAAPESLRHFLFSCKRWTPQRREMYERWPGKEGNMRFFLGAKRPDDTDTWKPDMEAIRTVIKYVRATARLDKDEVSQRTFN